MDTTAASVSTLLAAGGGGGLRDYQWSIANEALEILSGGESCLMVMATGLGKTRTAAEIVKNTPGRVLWIAHRTELISQAAQALAKACGEIIGWETSEPRQLSAGERIVVGSKDTVRATARLERLRQQKWSLLVIDEAHHASAQSYQAIKAAIQAPALGLTATPGRQDACGLGFQRHTRPMSVVEGIDSGWLVPVRLLRAKVRSVDLSQVSTLGGDFAPGELDAVMSAEQSIHGVAHAAMKSAGDRPTLIYCTSVESATRTAEVLCRYGAKARVVTGETPPDERRWLFKNFGTGYQYLCNVAVATEGTDLPDAGCIVLARPTKSRGLFQQILGRGLRTLPGVDRYPTAAERLAWLQSSAKPSCLLVDVVGTTGRHKLATADDLLADIIGATEAVRSKVARVTDAADGEIDVLAALRAEQAREKAAQEARDKRRANSIASRKDIVAKVDLELIRARFGQDIPELSTADPPTFRQIEQMVAYQLTPIPKGITRLAADALIKAAEQKRDIPSDGQIAALKRANLWRDGIGRKEASRIITKLYATRPKW